MSKAPFGSRLVLGVLMALASLPAFGCAGLEQIDRALYETVPVNPVTGRAVANLISPEQEMNHAAQQHAALVAAAEREGIGFDRPGARSEEIRRIFNDLVTIAHRSALPWQVHLIDLPEVNAFTPGGGYVYVLEGLFGPKGLVADGDDDELAAVLAHEVAHVTLLHASLRQSWQMMSDRAKKDPYFGASFTTDQEAEADRLAVLYMALAGYDPDAATRVWQRADRNFGSAPGRFLYDHPLNADRARLVADAAAQVRSYYMPGQRNPDWATIRSDNPLFPKTEIANAPGAGIAKALTAALEAKVKHDQTKDEAERREKAALASPEYQRTLVKVLAVQSGVGPDGRPIIRMQFQNGAASPVAALGVRVVYLNGQTPLANDPNCGGPATIPAGQTVWLACPAYIVPGASQFRVEITGVQFQ